MGWLADCASPWLAHSAQSLAFRFLTYAAPDTCNARYHARCIRVPDRALHPIPQCSAAKPFDPDRASRYPDRHPAEYVLHHRSGFWPHLDHSDRGAGGSGGDVCSAWNYGRLFYLRVGPSRLDSDRLMLQMSGVLMFG